MNNPRNTHQILYAKNFYQHSGDIIADMRKVCQLDEPNWDFSSPYQILKFMRNQFKIWLDNNPQISKESGEKVAWDSNPIRAEIWSILISYSVFIPMISKYINGLPRYDVIKPQYSATLSYNDSTAVFSKKMSVQECVDAAKTILGRTNLEILDIIADDAARRFNYKKAAKLLKEFGEDVTAKELDNELWDGYSQFIEEHLDENGNLPEKDYLMVTKHFTVTMCPIFRPNTSFNFDIQLNPIRTEYISEDVVTLENIKELAMKCRNTCVDQLRENGSIDKISKVANDLFSTDQTIWEEIPEHLTRFDLEAHIRNCIDTDLSYWERFGYNDQNYFEGFSKWVGGDYGVSGGGCFTIYTFNENGHMKTMLVFDTLFECGADDKSLWNGRIIDAPKY